MIWQIATGELLERRTFVLMMWRVFFFFFAHGQVFNHSCQTKAANQASQVYLLGFNEPKQKTWSEVSTSRRRLPDTRETNITIFQREQFTIWAEWFVSKKSQGELVWNSDQNKLNIFKFLLKENMVCSLGKQNLIKNDDWANLNFYEREQHPNPKFNIFMQNWVSIHTTPNIN